MKSNKARLLRELKANLEDMIAANTKTKGPSMGRDNRTELERLRDRANGLIREIRKLWVEINLNGLTCNDEKLHHKLNELASELTGVKEQIHDHMLHDPHDPKEERKFEEIWEGIMRNIEDPQLRGWINSGPGPRAPVGGLIDRHNPMNDDRYRRPHRGK